MRKKIIIFTAVIITGFLSGYFSDAISTNVSRASSHMLTSWKNWYVAYTREKNLRALNEGQADLDSKEMISAEAAVKAVKSLPEIKKRLASLHGLQLAFKTDQEPSDEYPVWLVEIREMKSDQVPDITFLKVDAHTGQVLDLRKAEFRIMSITPGLPAAQVSKILGTPLSTRKVWDSGIDGYLNSCKYSQLEIEFDRKNLASKIALSGSALKGPRNITLGLKKDQIIKKLGKAEISQGNTLIYSAFDDNTLQIHVRIDEKGIVSGISMIKTN